MKQMLNYELLERLWTNPHALEVTDIDVKRLRDDRSEIHAGQEIAFVAAASFRLTEVGCKALRQQLEAGHLASGDELLAIGPDADLHSDKLPIDDDSVARWLTHRYAFEFVLNGKPSPAFHDVGQVTIKLDDRGEATGDVTLPWIKKLNTIQIKDDYVDVDVQIRERAQAAPPVPARVRWPVEDSQIVVTPRDGERERLVNVALAVELDGHAPLERKTFRVGLHADGDDDAHVELIFTVGDAPAALDRPAGAPSNPRSTKHHT